MVMKLKLGTTSWDENGDSSADSSCKLPDWKVVMEQDILELRERILKLERESFFGLTLETLRSTKSFATAAADGYGGLRVCLHLIRSNGVARLQFIWFSIIAIIFLTKGLFEFVRAKENMDDNYKPVKMYKTIDYGDEDSDIQYEMPYIYMYFQCWNLDGSSWTDDRVNETLTALLESQNYFRNSTQIAYITGDFEMWLEHLPVVDVDILYEETWVYERSFIGYFRLKLSDPKTSLGAFQYYVNVNMPAMTLNGLIGLNGFWVSVSRETTTMNWEEIVNLPATKAIQGSKISSIVDYEEKVVRMWNNKYVNYFTVSLGLHYEWDIDEFLEDWEIGLFSLTLKGNLLVEYWDEYVSYTYYDWLSSMGGMLSFASILFFWGAYYLATLFGEKSKMGILPGMSFVFKNLETIHMLKDITLEKSYI